MATHSDIVKGAGKPEEVALACAVSPHTVRSWIQRDSIPPEKWAWFVSEKHASFEELAAARPERKARAA